jgi:translation initiation factor 3 subunit H
MVRVPAEASRLNSLLLLAQVDEFAKGMAGAAGGGVARMFAGQV